MEDFSTRVAVVTGAADGIGFALCEAFAAAGASVVMADIDVARLEAAAARLPGDRALAVPADVSRPESVEALADAAFERFGTVHVLCNNAGVVLPGRRIWNAPLADVEWMLRVNFMGVVHGIQAFVPRMLRGGEPGHVVNTASVGGLLGFPSIGAYSASKFAVVGLSESLHHDLHERDAPIGVSVLCPGATATGLGRNSAALRGSGGGDDADPQGTARATPAEIAEQVLAAIREERFWILTHPGYADLLERRSRAILGSDEELVAPGFFL
jgi:NAD(P)-dependent dehydrogenase (short-subunit alcohol dehydrogenase family)